MATTEKENFWNALRLPAREDWWNSDEVKEKIKEHWGYSSFRELMEEEYDDNEIHEVFPNLPSDRERYKVERRIADANREIALQEVLAKNISLTEIDLTKGKGHNHPDIKTDGTRYLCLINGSFEAGSFSTVPFGLSFFGGFVSKQYDTPGTNGSNWQRVWEIDFK